MIEVLLHGQERTMWCVGYLQLKYSMMVISKYVCIYPGKWKLETSSYTSLILGAKNWTVGGTASHLGRGFLGSSRTEECLIQIERTLWAVLAVGCYLISTRPLKARALISRLAELLDHNAWLIPNMHGSVVV